MAEPLRALIVEDSEDDATLVGYQLTAAGYELITTRVETAEAMHRALDEREWDAVIADYSLPRFSAPKALALMRERGLDLPFIIVSGAIGEETAVEAMRAGAHDYIMKHNLTRLAPAVERELREARVRRERREAEEALRESERTLSTLMSNLPGMAYRCLNDPRWAMLFVSEGCYDLTGYHSSVLSGANRTVSYGDLVHDDDREMVWTSVQEALAERRAFQLVYRIHTASGRERWVWEKGRGVFAADGGLSAIEGFISDVTEAKRAEEQIKASLQEKEVLLREIHHRVKNNLQIISSLLNLQSRYIQDERALDVFRESQNRIRSMVLIHEKLYRSKDLARVDFAEYVQSLASHLVRSYGTRRAGVDLRVHVEGVALPIDTAIPCGIIINELVTNALKHAFPDGRRGEIRIDLHPAEREYRLVVSDNGTGIPADLDFRKTESLGLQLVTTLTDQLDGTVELERDGGTRFTIVFPKGE
ncbi:MAG: PAS domain-containing protein [Phycisphaerae bacterium]|nr:PAS domain-containing protein [Phycisphaerae bacterium]